jgi:hypothetical protein
MSKKINQLDAASAAEIADTNNLFVIAIASTGLAKKVTRAQMRTAFAVVRTQHTATGSEGDTLTLSALASRNILMVTRESGPIYEAPGVSPNSTEYTWDNTDLVFGTNLIAGERVVILHQAP